MAALIMGAIGLVFAAMPQLWANIFTSDPGVLASAYSYLGWAAPAYGFFGLGLCLYFASQGAGKVLGPVLAGTARLLVVAVGGWWLAGHGTAEWSIFALIGHCDDRFRLADGGGYLLRSVGQSGSCGDAEARGAIAAGRSRAGRSADD